MSSPGQSSYNQGAPQPGAQQGFFGKFADTLFPDESPQNDPNEAAALAVFANASAQPQSQPQQQTQQYQQQQPQQSQQQPQQQYQQQSQSSSRPTLTDIKDELQAAVAKLEKYEIANRKSTASGPAVSVQGTGGPGSKPGSGKANVTTTKAKQLKQNTQKGGADLYEYKYLKYKAKYEKLLNNIN